MKHLNHLCFQDLHRRLLLDQLLGELPTAGQCAVFIHGWDLKRIRKQHSSDCLQYELVNPPGGVVSLARTGFKGVFVDADVLHAVIDGNSAVPLATGLPVPGHRHRFSAVHTVGGGPSKVPHPSAGIGGGVAPPSGTLGAFAGRIDRVRPRRSEDGKISPSVSLHMCECRYRWHYPGCCEQTLRSIVSHGGSIPLVGSDERRCGKAPYPPCSKAGRWF